MKYIDLFSGIGSFHYSLQKLGFECVMASDNNKECQHTYFTNYGIHPKGDICEIDPAILQDENGNSMYDILCAGFPCQPFSQAGKRLGFEDERGTMFGQVMKFVEFNNPKIVVLENVPGLLTHEHGNTFNRIRTTLEQKDYTVISKVMKCSDYGIPQMRKRLIIVAFHNESLPSDFALFFDLGEYEKQTTLSEYLGKSFVKDIAYTIRCGGRHSPIKDRHNWDGYILGDGTEYRLTIEDCLKLQGFDESFVLEGSNTQKWKMLGNTIPTVFTEIIGKQIQKYCSFVE